MDLPGHGGWIIGQIFARGTGAQAPALPLLVGIETLARWLVSECWGAYCAVLSRPGSRHLYLVCDPSGLMPVYRLRLPGHCIVTNDLGLIFAMGSAPRVSWSDLAGHLQWPELRARRTCLAGIEELVPGELHCLSDPSAGTRLLWQVERFLPSRPVRFDDALAELRELASSVLGAWAGMLGAPAVAASGGVDSTFICAALASAGQDFSCITVATADPSGDERRFVLQLGDHLGVRVETCTYDIQAIDLSRAASQGLPRPQRKTFMQALDQALEAAAHRIGTGAVIDGNGGDNLFCYLHSAAPVIDSLRLRGPGRATVATFLDMCRLTGADAATMARAVIRRMCSSSAASLGKGDTRLLAGDVSRAPQPLVPRLSAPVGRHEGKRDHLAMLMRCQNHLHGLISPGSLNRLSPLMSQPLVELCLSFPTWLWCHGGLNRAVARAAFANDIPREIATRTSKSGPDSFIRAVFTRGRAEIRDMLLGGLLAHHGILDRVATEAALHASVDAADSMIYRLLDLAEAEAWARSWEP